MKMLLRVLAVLILAAHLIHAAQGDEFAPGDNLIVEGIPKVAASLAQTASRYTNFRDAGLVLCNFS
jgi:hypothetical protein